MINRAANRSLAIAALLLLAGTARGETLSITLAAPAAPGQQRFMGAGAGSTTPNGSSTSPTGGTLGYDNLSLLKDGKPWLPVMGEFHFSRYPANQWRDELLKMKAGGITLVSTYVFWIHHEEVQGQFDWTGQRDLGAFIKTCKDVGLPVIVRIGPWCHGEVRNGGMPDWADAMPRKRTNDPAFLAAVKPLYAQIAGQLKGQLWKDGGPVIGIQCDNEFGGDPAYLLALKKMAQDCGIDVPIYTKTGWPAMRRPMPFGEFMPLFGAYAEGFWDRTLDTMPGNYWQAFTFSTERVDTAIASDIFGTQQDPTLAKETLSYPYLTCELGGGMMSSYHRRIVINPMDVLSIPLTKVGSGSNMPGYYMYHGGTNPDGKTTDIMQETQSRGMWNDLPYKTYDFQAPLGEFGQVRESYHKLRLFHMFLNDFGTELARMTPTFSTPAKPLTKTNNTDLRWAVRSDGKRGFVFVTNYQRGMTMPARPDTTFALKTASDNVTFPSVAIPADSCFFLPFNLDLGGANLVCATAQPVCKIDINGTLYTFFIEIPGIKSEFILEKGCEVEPVVRGESSVDAQGRTHLVATVPASFKLSANGKHQAIALLTDDFVWKGAIAGKERVVMLQEWGYKFDANGKLAGDDSAPLTMQPSMIFDGDRLRFTAQADASIIMMPPPESVNLLFGNGSLINSTATLSFTSMFSRSDAKPLPPPLTELLQPAGAPRDIKMGSQKVAEQPSDDDFKAAAIYRIKLPANLAAIKNAKLLLQLHYTGDVARVYLGDKLLDDNFYNGKPMDIGLWRYAPDIYTKELTIKILPLKKGAPIYMANWPVFPEGKDSVATLDKAEVIQEQTVTLQVK